MNVIISNQLDSLVNSLDIEVIKSLNGEFEVDDIISSFSNFFFNKMVLDVTALRNYEDVVTFQKLSIGLAVDKIILLIPTGSCAAKKSFLSQLISLGYYNFTTNSDGVYYLLEHPNTYKDVAHLHQINFSSSLVPEKNKYHNSNDNKNVSNEEKFVSSNNKHFDGSTYVLGIKNITDSAGATTLSYMIFNELYEHRRKEVYALEVNKRDFNYFNNDKLISTVGPDFINVLNRYKNDADVIIVDLNDYDTKECNDVLYLIEPSIIKMNKIVRKDRDIFNKLKDKKIILNKCVLSRDDVKEFEHEIGTKLFYVVPPIDDRQRQKCISELLVNLGIISK